MLSLIHWGRVTHICVSNQTIIGSNNGLSPGRRQAIIWTSAEILLIGNFWTNFSEILIQILTFSFNKMHLKMSSAKWRLFGLGLNELSLTGHIVKLSAINTLMSVQIPALTSTSIPWKYHICLAPANEKHLKVSSALEQTQRGNINTINKIEPGLRMNLILQYQ